MDVLLNYEAVTSQHKLRGLGHLYNLAETPVRGLRSLGVLSESYGGLLSSIIMSKLPQELRLIISGELTDREWDLDSIMSIIEREVGDREQSATNSSVPQGKPYFKIPPYCHILDDQ